MANGFFSIFPRYFSKLWNKMKQDTLPQIKAENSKSP